MASLKKVIEIVGTLTLAYPKVEIKKGMSTVWHGVLKDIPDEILDVAAKQILSENTWFPSVAELRQKSLQLMKPLFPTWGEAWDECINYINKFTWEQKEGFSHPLIEKAYKQIGHWDSLMTDDIPTVRAQFRQVYESLVYRAESDVKMLPEAKQISEQYRLEISNLVHKLEAKNE